MSKISLQVQIPVYHIPSPLYNYGDCLQWEWKRNERIFSFEGILQHRWWDDSPRVSDGQWMYVVKISSAQRDGCFLPGYSDQDIEVDERDLKALQHSKKYDVCHLPNLLGEGKNSGW